MAAPSSSSKRHSILPPISQAGPKPPIQFSSSIIIADSALLTGAHTITIRSESVVHPRARLESTAGRINIGRRCIVHERTHIGLVPSSASKSSSSSRVGTSRGSTLGALAEGGGGGGEVAPPSPNPTPIGAVTLGDYVTVEVAAVIEGGDTLIGDGTIVGVGSRIGAGAVIGKHCTLTPHTTVAPGERIPDFTVIYSNGARRLDKRGVVELRNKGQARQIEILRRMIPSNPAKFQ
ncbi:Trimeric LpxA-like protein [Naviculisporaceae sp. PSN 640]